MSLTAFEMVVVAAAITAVLMAGSNQLKVNLFFYAVETLLIGSATAMTAYSQGEPGMYWIALGISFIKGIAIPAFLAWTIERINIDSETGTVVAAPLAMHLTIVLLGMSYLFVLGLPAP